MDNLMDKLEEVVEQVSRISGSGSESQRKISVYCACDGTGAIIAYAKNGNDVFSISPDASGVNELDIVLPEGDYRLCYFSDPVGKSGQVYEGTLTIIP